MGVVWVRALVLTLIYITKYGDVILLLFFLFQIFFGLDFEDLGRLGVIVGNFEILVGNICVFLIFYQIFKYIFLEFFISGHFWL